MSNLRVNKAVDLAEEILDELALLPMSEAEFVQQARPRVEAIRKELVQDLIVSERSITTLREIAKGIEMRQPREPQQGERERLLH